MLLNERREAHHVKISHLFVVVVAAAAAAAAAGVIAFNECFGYFREEQNNYVRFFSSIEEKKITS